MNSSKVCKLDYMGALGFCNSKGGSVCRSCSWYVEESEARLSKHVRDEEDETRKKFLAGLRRNRRGKNYENH